MKMEQDLKPHHRTVKMAIRELGFIGIILLLTSCNNKNEHYKSPAININIVGSYEPNQRFKLKIEKTVVFDKILKENTIQDRRLVYYPTNIDSVEITFLAGRKDTSFIYYLKRKNYLEFSKTFAYHQLLVEKVDSAEFWHNVHDYVQ